MLNSPTVSVRRIVLWSAAFQFACTAHASADDAQEQRAAALLAVSKVGSYEEATQEMTLSGVRVNDALLKQLVHFPELRGLDLEDARISDDGLGAIAGLARLQAVSLAGTQITAKGLAHLSGLTELTHLNLVGCHALDDDALSHLSKLQKLRTLSLDNVRSLTDEALPHIAKLSQLRILTFEGCSNIKGHDLDQLAALPHLETLNLYGTNVDDKGLEALAKIKTLEELHLAYCRQLRSAGLKSLVELKELKELTLMGCLFIGNEAVQYLKPLVQLEVLDLRGTRIAGDELEALKKALPDTKIHAFKRPASLIDAGPSPGLEVRVEVDGYLSNQAKQRLIREIQGATDEPETASYSIADTGGRTVVRISHVLNFEEFLLNPQGGKVISRDSKHRVIKLEFSDQPAESSP